MQVLANSQVDFYVNLCTQLISDDPLRTVQPKSLARDIATLRSRVAHEGLSFITKILPRLGKALDVALVEGRFTIPCEFRSAKGRKSPAFMQAYFNLVFDEDGVLQENIPWQAVKHLRQVLFFGYKLELPYSRSDEDAVISNFISTDRDLAPLDNGEARENISLAALISGKILKDFDPLDIIPRHGPGAVATGERLEEKWVFTHKYSALHRVFPYYQFMMVGWGRELSDRLAWYKSMEVHENGTAKVVLVPKDSRGPRLISCEPLEYQWIQQGLGRKLVNLLESHRLTRGRINFTHQGINQQLALASSTSREFATIDLKDASDRVSLELVKGVLRRSPNLVRALEASRSKATVLPNGEIVCLSKFAPMGSALCFPVEAFVFWLIMVAAMIRETSLPLEKVGERIYVYGDDIIIPTRWAPRCIQALESVGLVVNASKSCITGSFRESCGVDAFNGFNVTPLRLRKQWTGRVSDGSALSAFVSLANRLDQHGYKGTALLLWNEIEAVYGKIPYGVTDSPFPCRWAKSIDLAITLNRGRHRMRFNQKYQRLEFYVLKLHVRRINSQLDGWPRLMRSLSMPVVGDPSFVVVPRSTRIKRGWAAVR